MTAAPGTAATAAATGETGATGSAPGPGRRERKRRASNELLYESALALFVEQGFEATTVDQIAARADVARATAFNHYPQKAGYLEEWGRRRRARVQARLHAAGTDPGGGPQAAAAELRAYLTEMARINEESREETRALMDPAVRRGDALSRPTLDVDLAQVIRVGQRRGELREDVDAGHVATVLAATYFVTVLQWCAVEPAPFSLHTRLQETLDLVLPGLR